jgi:lipoate-protein ligase A
MKQNWRFIDSGLNDAATNMAMDEAILIAHSEGKVPPTIRFYGWSPPTLTVGYFQKLEAEIDLEEVRRRKLGLVRRMTGGRAVLHADELTYSVIISEQEMPQSVIEAYRQISEGLLYGFRSLGLDAHFSVPLSDEEKKQLKNPRSAVCFDAPSWYELVVEGRKVAGSAQTRQKGVVLQHGSIPLTLDIDELFDVFKFSSEEVKQRLKRRFPQKAVAINELRSAPATLAEVKEAFRNGFALAFNTELVEGKLTKEEELLVQQLVKEKYGSDAWNYRA